MNFLHTSLAVILLAANAESVTAGPSRLLPFKLNAIVGAQRLAHGFLEDTEMLIPGVRGRRSGRAMGVLYRLPAATKLNAARVFGVYEKDLIAQGFKVQVHNGQIPGILEKLCAAQDGFCGKDLSKPDRGAYDRFATFVRKSGDEELVVSVIARKAAAGGDTTMLVTALWPPEIDVKMAPEDVSFIRQRLDRGGSVDIYGIHFDENKATIKPESETIILEIAKVLQADSSLSLDVIGHTDSVGDSKYNQILSQRRAEAVVAALTARHGIASNSLTAAGFGESHPVSTNDTEEGRYSNRRVELKKRKRAG